MAAGSQDGADRVGEFNTQELLDLQKQLFEVKKELFDQAGDAIKDCAKQTGSSLSSV
jgi:hypothetical protein